jgi:predicted transcriptional regulator
MNRESESHEASIQKALREETKILDLCRLTPTILRSGLLGKLTSLEIKPRVEEHAEKAKCRWLRLAASLQSELRT